jgi:hypothetical protein
VTRRLLSCAVIVGVIAFQPFVDAGAFQRVVAPPSIMEAPAPEPTMESADTDAPHEAIAAAEAAARAAAPATPTPAPFVPAGGLAPDPTTPPVTAAPATAAPAPPTPQPTAAPVTIEATVSTPEPQEASGNARAVDQAGYVYSYAVDENRYDDIATSIDAYKPFGSPKMRFRPYVAALYNRDTRTNAGTSGQNGGPPVPLVLADNYALGAAGLQYTTPGGLRLFGQVGRSFTVGPVAAQPSGNDARGGAQLYREWGPAYEHGQDYGNFYGSVEYLSRYSDTISYNQLELVRNAGNKRLPVEIFGRVVATLDTKQHYYSNVLELTAGIRVHPFGVHGPIVSVEQTGGDYLRGTLPQNVRRAYLDFRPTISYGFNI